VVTNISPFVDDEYKNLNQCEATIHTASFIHFKLACKNFLKIMSSDEHPVVMFIDDIQWMDTGSKKLLESLMLDTSINNLLLILAFREEDASYLDAIFLGQVNDYLDIKLGNFDVEAIHEMVLARLDIDKTNASKDISSLSSLIVQKTNGNPLHVVQFLEAIEKDGLLTFHSEESKWIFDIERLQKETMISDSLADLISKKVTRLDKETQTLLKAMSLSPCHFTEESLHALATNVLGEIDTEEDYPNVLVRPLLCKAIKEGMIEETSDGYQFTHDRIRSGFQSIMGNDERENLHVVLGKMFRAGPSKYSKYLAAVHFNCVTALMTRNGEDRRMLAKIYVEASEYCQLRSFEAARSFLQKGLSLLENDEKWTANFDLSFKMTRSLAKIESWRGNLEGCLSAVRELLCWAKSTEDTTDALLIEIDARITTFSVNNVLKEGKQIFYALGYSIPRMMTPFHLFHKLRRVRRLIIGKKDEDILDSSDIPGNSRNLHMIFSKLSIYFFQRKAYALSLYTSLLVLEHAMEFGFSSSAAISLVVVGAFEIFMGNTERGCRFGKLVKKWASLHRDCTNSKMAEVLAALFINFKQENTRFCTCTFSPDELVCRNGDFSVAEIILETPFLLRVFNGEPLKPLEASLQQMCHRLTELGQNNLLCFIHCLLQLTLNLRNKDRRFEDLCVLTGEIMDEENYLSLYGTSLTLKMVLQLSKLLLTYTLGFYNKAEEALNEILRPRAIRSDRFLLRIWITSYTALTNYARYYETGRRRYIRKARKSKRVLQKLHSLDIPDATTHLKLVDIEELGIEKHRTNDICRAVDSSIAYLRAQESKHFVALANERAYMILSRLGCLEASRSYLKGAILAYKEWNADAKCEWLSKQYNDVQKKPADVTRDESSNIG